MQFPQLLVFEADGRLTSALQSLFNDSTATVDIATTSGDAAAAAIESMLLNEALSGFGAALATDGAASPEPTRTTTINRTKTCYNAAGAVVAGCVPLSSVRKIVTRVTTDGKRSGGTSVTGGTTATWSGAVHSVSNDTIVRNFNTATPSVETSRVHSDGLVGHDTTTFIDPTTTRTHAEAYHDVVNGVTWNLPKGSYPSRRPARRRRRTSFAPWRSTSLRMRRATWCSSPTARPAR